MTEERKVELIEKIQKIVDNDATAFAGVESDIRIVKGSMSGEIVIDMLVHFMNSQENDPEAMNMSYAASKSVIRNATQAQLEKSCQLMHQIIESSLIGMDMPGGEQERADVERALDELGRQKMFNFLPMQ